MIPKPAPAAYDSFLRRFGLDPKRSAMFEDIAKNLVVPRALGMTTTLVIARAEQIDYREAHDRMIDDALSIDFVTSDLAGFLASINVELRAR